MSQGNFNFQLREKEKGQSCENERRKLNHIEYDPKKRVRAIERRRNTTQEIPKITQQTAVVFVLFQFACWLMSAYKLPFEKSCSVAKIVCKFFFFENRAVCRFLKANVLEKKIVTSFLHIPENVEEPIADGEEEIGDLKKKVNW